jgi:hypothetical protein
VLVPLHATNLRNTDWGIELSPVSRQHRGMPPPGSSLAWRRSSFREVNELIVDSASRHTIEGRLTGFLCECGEEGCLQAIYLSLPEFDAVRAEPGRYALALDHAGDASDRLLARNERFAVVVAADVVQPPAADTVLFAAPPAAA